MFISELFEGYEYGKEAGRFRGTFEVFECNVLAMPNGRSDSALTMGRSSTR